MNKIKKVVVLIVLSSIISPVFAVNEHTSTHVNEQLCTEGKVCFADEIMKEVIKESIQTVGKHLLEKYLNDVNTPKNTDNTEQNTTNTGNTRANAEEEEL